MTNPVVAALPKASLQWADIIGKPSTFLPSAHVHPLSDISGLGTGVAAALAIAIGSVGGPVVKGGDIGAATGASLNLSTALNTNTINPYSGQTVTVNTGTGYSLRWDNGGLYSLGFAQPLGTTTNPWGMVTSASLQTYSGVGVAISAGSGYTTGVRLQSFTTDGKMRIGNFPSTSGCYFDLNTADTLTIRNFADSAGGSIACTNVTSSGAVTAGSGSADTRAIFRSVNSFAFGVGRATGTYYLGASASGATPDLVFSNNAGSETGRLTDGGNFTASGTGIHKFGPGTGVVYSIVDGANTGTTTGAAFVVRNGGVDKGLFGNRSAVTGGAYDATMVLYAGSGSGLDFCVNGGTTPKARILSNGAFGIGTNNPANLLDVGDGTGLRYIAINGDTTGTTTGSALRIQNGSVDVGGLGNKSAIAGGAYDGTFFLSSATSNPIVFGVSNVEKARIDSSGNFTLTGNLTNSTTSLSVSGVNNVNLQVGGNTKVQVTSSNNFNPASNNLINLGTSSLRWANYYGYGPIEITNVGGVGSGDRYTIYHTDTTYNRSVGLYHAEDGAEGGLKATGQIKMKPGGQFVVQPSGQSTVSWQMAVVGGELQATPYNSSIVFLTSAALIVPFKIRGSASQSASLFECQDSSSNVLTKVIPTGGINLTPVGASHGEFTSTYPSTAALGRFTATGPAGEISMESVGSTFGTRYGYSGEQKVINTTGSGPLRFRTATGGSYMEFSTVGVTALTLGTSGAATFGSAGYAMSAMGSGDIRLNNGTNDTPGIHFCTGANTNWGMDSSAGTLRTVQNLDETGGVVVSSLTTTGQYRLNSTGNAMLRLSSSAGSALIYDLVGTGTNFNIGDGTTNILVANAANATFSGTVTSTFQSLSANPTTVDLSAGQSRLVKNTTSGVLSLFANDGGTIKSVALT